MRETPTLRLEFSPRTIEHLGPKLYSRLPPAIAELVANAYDANASLVRIAITGPPSKEVISVTDDGHGMSPDDVQELYLQIGRDRRTGAKRLSRGGSREVSGKKGLGKLAMFGIGHLLEVSTRSESSPLSTRVTLKWNEIMSQKGGTYLPDAVFSDVKDSTIGTSVTVSELQRSSIIDAESLADSLARLFSYADKDFRIVVCASDGSEYEVDEERRRGSYDLTQNWSVPSELPTDDFDELRVRGVEGWLGVSQSVIPASLRGIAVFAKGRRVSSPGFFGEVASDIGYAYVVGEITADFLDDLEPDVISTARTDVDWDTDETQLLRSELGALVRFAVNERRKSRKVAAKESIKSVTGITRDVWTSSVNGPQRASLDRVLDEVSDPDNELVGAAEARVIKAVFELAPAHAEWVWRTLHSELHADSVRRRYETASYHSAVQEAVTLMIEYIRRHASVNVDTLELDTINAALGAEKILVAIGPSHPAFELVSESTRKNIDSSLPEFARGLWKGFRHPLDHHSESVLVRSTALTFQDCLDALSLISHILRRIDQSEVRVVDVETEN